MITLGPTNYFSGEAAAKLVAAQVLMHAGPGCTGGRLAWACRLCGEGMLDGEALLRCERCRKLTYCCAEHQRAHWKLHKKNCTDIH